MAATKSLKASEIKIGDLLKAKNDNYISYGISKGDIVKVHQKSGANVMVEGCMSWVPINMFEKAKFTKQELYKEKNDLERAIAEINNKLEWMQATGSQEYDETEYKVWLVLQAVNSESTEMDKIKAIAKLIKN